MCISVCSNFKVWENLGNLSLVKSGKLNHIFRLPPVFGSCNSKMLLIKYCDNMDLFWKVHETLSWKNFYYHISFLLIFWLFSQNVTRDFFCNNSYDVETIKFNRLHNRKYFLFHVSFKLVWLKREKIYIFLLINYLRKKCYFIIFQVQYTAIIFQKY